MQQKEKVRVQQDIYSCMKNAKKSLDVGLEPTASRLEVLRATLFDR